MQLQNFRFPEFTLLRSVWLDQEAQPIFSAANKFYDNLAPHISVFRRFRVYVRPVLASLLIHWGSEPCLSTTEFAGGPIGHTNNVAEMLNKITSTCNIPPPPLTCIASYYFALGHANAIIGFSNYGQLLRDLVAVLLRTEPERRPSAEQILCIPMMQSHVNDYVGRMSTIREQFTPLPIRRLKRAHDNAGVSPNGERENVSSF